jgi:2-methylcitrate dehydratase PrpD
MMDRVKVEPDAKLPRGVSCLMVMETVKGETYRAQVDYPKGSKQNPMGDKELIGKFTKLSKPVVDPKDISSIVDTALSLEKVKNVKDLTRHFQKGD